MTVVNVRPGETVTVIGLPAIGGGGPVDPGYSPPWAQVRPPIDPGYSPPWAQVPPGAGGGGPVDPGYGVDIGTGPVRPTHPIVIPPPVPVDPEHPWVPPGGTPPVDPGYSPPWATVPDAPDGGGGVWVWAWSPQAGRWVWVRVPGKGEAGPKAAAPAAAGTTRRG